MPPVLNKHCNGCGICAAVCPCDVLSHEHGHQVPRVLYPDECWYCDACVLDCPAPDGHKGIELHMPLQLQVLWVDPRASKEQPFDVEGDLLGNRPGTGWDMPR